MASTNTLTNNKSVEEKFNEIYLLYFSRLFRFAKRYVLTNEDAENIVQDVFLDCWEQQNKFIANENIQPYLFRLTKNKCIDFLRHIITAEEKQKEIHEIHLKEYNLLLHSIEQFDDSLFSDRELEEIIQKAIDHLPEKCREIFILSKIEGMKYDEIATQMNLSPLTVRNQVAIAIKKMKEELKDFLPLLLFLIS